MCIPKVLEKIRRQLLLTSLFLHVPFRQSLLLTSLNETLKSN